MFCGIGIDCIVAVEPSTIEMLNRLLPTMSPIAIPGLCFITAISALTSSGRLVLSAISVIPITVSLRLKNIAMFFALLMNNELAMIRNISEIITIIQSIITIFLCKLVWIEFCFRIK